MPARIAVEGVETIRSNLQKLGRKYPDAMAAAIYKLGVVILSNSLPRVPVEYAVLRTSGYVSPPEGKGIKANVEVGFGTTYAVPQHERTDYKHPRGGEAKYLEKAINAVAPTSLQRLAQWVIELSKSEAKWGAADGTPTRPRVSNSNRKSKSQSARLKRAAANVRKRTGR